ncbi:TPA: hypothetical protein ACX6RC_003528 [Photobacterium damselae]
MIVKYDKMLILLTICLFFPGMVGYFGLVLEQILTIALFGFSLIIIFINNLTLTRKQYICILLFYGYFQISVVISLLASTDIFILNDAIEIAKPLYLLSFFILPFCFRLSFSDLDKIVKYIITICFLLSCWGIFEAWTSLGRDLSFLLYKPNRAILANKAVGPFIITYVFASFLVFPFFYFLIMTISSKNKLNKYSIFAMMCLFCIFSTQSKTVFLSILFTLFVFTLLIICYKNIFNKSRAITYLLIITILIASSFGIVITLFQDKFSYIFNGLNALYNTLNSYGVMNAINSMPSTQLRYEQFLFAVNNQTEIPLFGVGIGKGVFMPESLYAMYLYRFGVVGILLHFLMLLILLFFSKRNADYFYLIGNRKLNAFFLAIHFYVISLPLSYFSSAVNDQTRTGFIFYILFGLTLCINFKIDQNRNEKNEFNKYNNANI